MELSSQDRAQVHKLALAGLSSATDLRAAVEQDDEAAAGPLRSHLLDALAVLDTLGWSPSQQDGDVDLSQLDEHTQGAFDRLTLRVRGWSLTHDPPVATCRGAQASQGRGER
jgi:hypothetical protein